MFETQKGAFSNLNKTNPKVSFWTQQEQAETYFSSKFKMFAFLEKEFLGMKYVNCKGKEIVPRWGFHFKFSLHSIIIFFPEL